MMEQVSLLLFSCMQIICVSHEGCLFSHPAISGNFFRFLFQGLIGNKIFQILHDDNLMLSGMKVKSIMRNVCSST